MIGVSLPYEWLAGKPDERLGDPKALLCALKKKGVSCIELRTVFLRHDPREVLRVADMLWDLGLSITVHVKAHSAQQAVAEVFEPVSEVLRHLCQERLILTLHPVQGDNAAMLKALAAHRDEMGYPVVLALENNRLLPDHSEGDATALVLDAVSRANERDVGICFDMGHFLYYRKKNLPHDPEFLPPPAFWERVVHTHIHALKGLKTHFPIPNHEIPLRQLLALLGDRYHGVYNLELDFPRFWDSLSPIPSLLDSVEALQEDLPLVARTLEDLRQNFDARLKNASTLLERPREAGCAFSLITSSSYLFTTNGYRWAMDPSLRAANRLAKTPAELGSLWKELDLVIITHGHADHFERETVEKLAGNATLWLVPEFLRERALTFGIDPKRLILCRAGEPVQLGPLRILPFEGRHFRPVTKKGIEALGYHISASGAPSLVFPCDVRDYSLENLPALPSADYCFSHVWLGDNAPAARSNKEIHAAFAAFFLRFSQKTLFLTHLYESGREEKSLWTNEHAELLRSELLARSPCTSVLIPRPGEITELI